MQIMFSLTFLISLLMYGRWQFSYAYLDCFILLPSPHPITNSELSSFDVLSYNISWLPLGILDIAYCLFPSFFYESSLLGLVLTIPSQHYCQHYGNRWQLSLWIELPLSYRIKIMVTSLLNVKCCMVYPLNHCKYFDPITFQWF